MMSGWHSYDFGVMFERCRACFSINKKISERGFRTDYDTPGRVGGRGAGGTARADPSGRVAGTSLRDYVTLPADAKVAVALEVHGDGVTGVGAQGFLELRKL